MSRSEFDGPREHFGDFDRNGDGFMTANEVQHRPPRRGHRPPGPRRSGRARWYSVSASAVDTNSFSETNHLPSGSSRYDAQSKLGVEAQPARGDVWSTVREIESRYGSSFTVTKT